MRSVIVKAFVLTAVLVACVFGALPPAAFAQGSPPEPLSRPDWAAIFSPDGRVIDLRGGLDAVFLEDKISDGLGVDMSVVAPVAEPTVDNGIVTGVNDLGNGYLYARTDTGGNLQIYAGAEVLDPPVDGYVDFEFHRGVVQVLSGVPWQVNGERTPGDVLVRVGFAGGALGQAMFMVWNGAGYQLVAIPGADACSGLDYLVCVDGPPQETFQPEAWDAAYNLVQVRQPGTFVEVGFNVVALLGSNVEFTSIEVRTTQDIILDSFRRMGSWARQGQ